MGTVEDLRFAVEGAGEVSALLLRPVCAKLGTRVTLHIIETADHSFHVLKKSGRSDAEVLRELAGTTVLWAEGIEGKQATPQNSVGAGEPGNRHGD